MTTRAPGMRARWPLACFLALGLFWGTWAALIPEIKTHVGASDGEMGFALVAAGLGSLPAMVLTGRLWRRFRWRLLPPAALLFGAAAFGPALASTPATLAVALFAIGAASGTLDVSMNSAISDVEVAHDRRLMYGAHALFSLGVLIGAISTGVVRQAGGMPIEALAATAAFTTLVAVGCLFAAQSARTEREQVASTAGARFSLLRALAVLAALGLVGFLIEDATQNWSALLLEREIGTGPALGAAAPGLFAGAMFVGRSSGQWLGARYSDRVLLVTGAVITAVGLLASSVTGVALLALAGVGLAGAGIALVAPALFARAGRLGDPQTRATAIATMTTVGYSGFVLGPFVVGLLAQAYGLRFAFAALAALSVALAVSGLLVLRRSAGRLSFQSGEELLRTSRG